MTEKLSWFWTFFVSRFRVTLILAIFMILGGLSAYSSIPRELNPEVEVPFGVITTIYPGASTADVENSITNIIENKVKNIDNLKEITSRSKNSISSVIVEFETGTDLDKNIDDLKDLVDEIIKDLPREILNDPIITEASVSSLPIMTLSLGGDFALSELKEFADIIEEETSSISGLKEVNITGISDEQFHIYLNPYKLKSHKLSTDKVIQAITQANLDIPFGSIDIAGETVDVRGVGKIRTIKDFQLIPIINQKGTVLLGDIANIRQEFDTQEVETYTGSIPHSLPSISIDFVKAEKKVNINKISNKIFEKIKLLKEKKEIPQTLKVDTVFNSADEIQKSLDTLIISGIQTILIIAVILWIFLGWREALLSLIAIPLSMLTAILTLYILGETFNFLSLFALILSLGLLVDNAIIMSEAISENIRIKRIEPIPAANKAIADFRWPIITGTFTTIFAFLPMIFMISGVSGDFISIIPITVTIMLTISLFVSIFLLPALGVLFFRLFPPKENKEVAFVVKIKKWYEKIIKKILNKKRNIILVIICSLLSIVSAALIMLTGFIKIEVFPEDDVEVFIIELELPKGTSIDKTREQTKNIDKVLGKYLNEKNSWLDNYTIFVGQKSPYDPNVAKNGINDPAENILGVTVTMTNKKEREITSQQASAFVQSDLIKIIPSHIKITTNQEKAGPGNGGAPIEVKISSNDLNHLEYLAHEMEIGMNSIKLKNGAKLKNINNDFGERNKQIVWHFDRLKMIKYGLTVGQLQTTLRAALEGVSIFDITEGNETVSVVIRLNFDEKFIWKNQQSLEILNQIPIQTPQGAYISLNEIADFNYEEAIPIIRHIDTRRTVKLTADIDGNGTPKEFDEYLFAVYKKSNPRSSDIFSIGGDSEESNRLVSEMAKSMSIAIFLILLVLILQFDSFSQSFVMIFLIPLSLVTVFWGFGIGGQISDLAIGFPTMIGIVALSGIMINDAIVFVNRYNRHRTHNQMSRPDALTRAGVERFQPIFLTSVTTVFGLLPLALSDPVWAGLGFAIIFGMTTSTITTLFILPCLLISIQRGSENIYKFFKN